MPATSPYTPIVISTEITINVPTRTPKVAVPTVPLAERLWAK